MNPAIARISMQVGVAGIAGYGGYKATSALMRSTFRNDLTGSRIRTVEQDNQWVIEQRRTPQGTNISRASLGLAIISAGAGTALLFPREGAPAWRALVRAGGGAALAAAGVGIIAGAVATSMQYLGADVRPAQ